MSKMKTNKCIKKRIRVTAKGKVIHRRAGTSHLMSGMSSKRKRKLRKRGSTVGREARKAVIAVGGKA